MVKLATSLAVCSAPEVPPAHSAPEVPRSTTNPHTTAKQATLEYLWGLKGEQEVPGLGTDDEMPSTTSIEPDDDESSEEIGEVVVWDPHVMGKHQDVQCRVHRDPNTGAVIGLDVLEPGELPWWYIASD